MTERLSPADAAALLAEEPAAPLHVGGVVVIRPVGDFDFRRLVAVVESRLDQLPRYRQLARPIPGRLARPVWIDDDDFDIGYHVRRSSLPRPGSMDQLDELVGRLVSRQLDRNRPLWELYLIEGLEDGRVAVVNKTHQALVDRMGAVDIAAAILDDVAVPPAREPVTPWVPTPAPSAPDLVIDAIADIVTSPKEALDAVRLTALDLRAAVGGFVDTVRAVADVARRTIRADGHSALTSATGGPRVFSSAGVDLADLKRVREVHGGSINDVILAVLTGAARWWLLSRGDPVSAEPGLRALVPVSVRSEGPDQPAGVASYLVDLPVSEPNPVLRLHQVSYAMRSHLESGRQIGADALMALGRLAPPTLHAMGARVAGQLSRRSYDLLVTNVPGPQSPLFAAGDPVEAMYPVVPLEKGHAVAVGCTSYRGRVYFGLTADRDAMPDAAEFSRLIKEAADELVATVPRRRGGRGTTRRRDPGAGAQRRTGITTTYTDNSEGA